MLSKLKIKHRILLGYFIPILITFAVSGLALFGVRDSVGTFRKVDQENQILRLDQALLEAALENETGFRGFIITGKDEFFESLASGRRGFVATLATLKTLFNDDTRRLAELSEIENIMRFKLQAWQDPIIELRRKTNPNSLQEAISIIGQGAGKQIMEELRAKIADLKLVRHAQLRSGQESVERASSSAMLYVFVGFVLGTAIAVAAAVRISSRIAQTINDAVTSVSASTMEIAARVKQQERTAMQQSSSVSETTGTMANLGLSSRQSAEQAEAASASAQQALILSEHGHKTVDQTLQGMAALKEKVDAIALQILSLSEQSSQIGNITNLVSDLANQTNLLALNAAVEAVRAGEHGKGFAVLAAEIRKLADQSKKSAEKIHSLVTDIMRATNSTVMVTEEGTKTVGEGIQLVQRTGEAFNSLAASIGSASESVEQIAMNVKMQAAAIKHVVDAMQSIDDGAKDTAAGIAQTHISIAQLNQAALSLKAMV